MMMRCGGEERERGSRENFDGGKKKELDDDNHESISLPHFFPILTPSLGRIGEIFSSSTFSSIVVTQTPIILNAKWMWKRRGERWERKRILIIFSPSFFSCPTLCVLLYHQHRHHHHTIFYNFLSHFSLVIVVFDGIIITHSTWNVIIDKWKLKVEKKENMHNSSKYMLELYFPMATTMYHQIWIEIV